MTRDDLKDGGASVFYETVQEIRRLNNECKIEVLIPDFRGDETAIQKVIDAAPDVMNHNIEVVEDLFPHIRPQGNYQTKFRGIENNKNKGKKNSNKIWFHGRVRRNNRADSYNNA